MNWYSLRVMSGKEEKIKDNIFRELEYEKDLAENVEDILIPTENVVDIKNGKNIGLIVQSGCNYFSSFQYPEDIDAGIRVTKIGTSSVRYEVGLFKEKDQTSAADGFFVHVYVDRKTNNPIPLNYDFKKTLDTIFVDL